MTFCICRKFPIIWLPFISSIPGDKNTKHLIFVNLSELCIYTQMLHDILPDLKLSLLINIRAAGRQIHDAQPRSHYNMGKEMMFKLALLLQWHQTSGQAREVVNPLWRECSSLTLAVVQPMFLHSPSGDWSDDHWRESLGQPSTLLPIYHVIGGDKGGRQPNNSKTHGQPLTLLAMWGSEKEASPWPGRGPWSPNTIALIDLTQSYLLEPLYPLSNRDR